MSRSRLSSKLSDIDRRYEVGYGKPPIDTRFQPGESGNKKGRPKRQKILSELTSACLNRKLSVVENGKRKFVTVLEAILMKQASLALNGDSKAARFLLDHSRTETPPNFHEEALAAMAAELDL